MSNLEGSELTKWLCIFVPACCSLTASVWMLGSYALFPKLQTPTMRLVMLKSIVQILYSLAYNVAFYNIPEDDTPECSLQGWGIVFGGLCSVLLTAAMAGYMVLTIEQKQRIALTYTRLGILSAVVATISAVLASVPLIFDQYANLGGRCWIAAGEGGRDRRIGNILRFTVYYGVIWLCISFILLSFYKVAKYLQLTNNFRSNIGSIDSDPKKVAAIRSHATYVHRTISVLFMYPVISIFAWAPNTVLRTITAINPDYQTPDYFAGICLASASAQGAFYGMVFWRYRAVNTEWKRVFRMLQSKLTRTFFSQASQSSAMTINDEDTILNHPSKAFSAQEGARYPDTAVAMTTHEGATRVFMTTYAGMDDDGSFDGGKDFLVHGVNPITAPGEPVHKKVGIAPSSHQQGTNQNVPEAFIPNRTSDSNSDSFDSGKDFVVQNANPITVPSEPVHKKVGIVSSSYQKGTNQDLREVLIPNSASKSTINQASPSKSGVSRNANFEKFGLSRPSAHRGRGGGRYGRNRVSENISRFSSIMALDMDLPEDVPEDEEVKGDGDGSTLGTRNGPARVFNHNIDAAPSSKRTSNHNIMSSDRPSSFSYASHDSSTLADSSSVEL